MSVYKKSLDKIWVLSITGTEKLGQPQIFSMSGNDDSTVTLTGKWREIFCFWLIASRRIER